MEGSKRQKRKPETVDLNTLMKGHIPPQALEMETYVLGALLVEPDCVDDVLDELREPACFYDPRNRIIFEAILQLRNAKNHAPVDMLSLTHQLTITEKIAEVGGAQYIAGLTSSVGSAAHVEYYAKILKQKFIQRQLITASYSILKTAYDDQMSLEALVDMAQTEIFRAVDDNSSKDVQNIGGVIDSVLNELENLQKQTGRYSGVPSGFTTLDDITLGWQPSDLIILAARPSVGKTAFALNVARNAAAQNFPVAIFSLEMPSKQLVKRMLISETGLDSKKLKGGVKMDKDDWARLESKMDALYRAPIYIDDTPSLPVMEFRSKVKRLVAQKGVKLVLVDYLQLMQGPSELRGMREQEVAAISRTLKATAKEHNVPIIALSQLSRQAVTRQTSNNRPQLSDLRESGSIEQDADMVLFIHRLDYQGLNGDDVPQGQTQLIIAKHRNGEIGDVDLMFKSSEAKFVDAKEEQLLETYSNESMDYPSKMNSMTDDADVDYMQLGPSSDPFLDAGGFPVGGGFPREDF